jgi:hypothetical protein
LGFLQRQLPHVVGFIFPQKFLELKIEEEVAQRLDVPGPFKPQPEEKRGDCIGQGDARNDGLNNVPRESNVLAVLTQRKLGSNRGEEAESYAGRGEVRLAASFQFSTWASSGLRASSIRASSFFKA